MKLQSWLLQSFSFCLHVLLFQSTTTLLAQDTTPQPSAETTTSYWNCKPWTWECLPGEITCCPSGASISHLYYIYFITHLITFLSISRRTAAWQVLSDGERGVLRGHDALLSAGHQLQGHRQRSVHTGHDGGGGQQVRPTTFHDCAAVQNGEEGVTECFNNVFFKRNIGVIFYWTNL